MNEKEILASIRQEVKPIYQKLKCWAHGWKHIEKVVDSARILAEMEGADLLNCQIAAYCHDLGRLEEEERGLVDSRPRTSLGHAEFSLKPAEKILDKYGINSVAKEKILEAIKVHPIKKYEGDNEIALILQDADRSNGFGPMGILRLAVFNCELDIDEPTDDQDVLKKVEQVREMLNKDEAKKKRMLETLGYVAAWYDVLLNTKSAKKYLLEDYRYNQEFIKSLN